MLKKGNYYVRNKDLVPEIHKYKETGKISEELGSMIFKIAKNYANKGSFSRYTWKEDMIGEAVLTCVKYIHNFDPSKQKHPNPFAYITTICHNAFINFIRKQKRHSEIKDRCFKKVQVIENFTGYVVKGINYELIKPEVKIKKKKKLEESTKNDK